MSTLEIKDLYASVETKDGRKQILKGVNLTVNSGETHAIMGPNGSGKSTLAYTLAGHPKYEVESGQALLDGEDLLTMTPDERAKAGLFLAMQYPVEVPGVSMTKTGPAGSSSIAFCTGSVVVPLTAETTDRFCPVTAFTTLDLPALRRPKKPMCGRSADTVSFSPIDAPPQNRKSRRLEL